MVYFIIDIIHLQNMLGVVTMDAKSSNATERKTRLERIEQRIAQLERQKKAIQARENEKKRKERTRRLIQIGAIAIKYFDCPNDIEPEEFEKRIKVLINGIPKSMGHE